MSEKHDRYKTFDTLRDAMKLKLVVDNPLRVEYHKMIQTGDLDFHDYGVGFLNFELDACPCRFNPSAYPTAAEDDWYMRIWIANIDDGDMGAWSKPMPEAKARRLVQSIVYVIKDMVVFPAREELNVLLRPFGMTVDFEC